MTAPCSIKRSSPAASGFGNGDNGPFRLRRRHRRRRRCRLRARQSPVGALGNARALARSGVRLFAGQRAGGRARFLSAVLLQRRVFLARAEGALAATGQFAASRIFPRPRRGRRLHRDGYGCLSRHARRLRGVAGGGRRRLGLGRYPAPFTASSKTISISTASCTARTGRCRSGAPSQRIGRRWQRPCMLLRKNGKFRSSPI